MRLFAGCSSLSGRLHRPFIADVALAAGILQDLLRLLTAVGAVGPYPQVRVIGVDEGIEDLAVVHIRRCRWESSDELVLNIGADVVLYSRSTRRPRFPVQRPATSFRVRFASLRSAGISPFLIGWFSSRRLPCIGTGTREASISCAPAWPRIPHRSSSRQRA